MKQPHKSNGASLAIRYRSPRFAKVAESFPCVGVRIENPGELKGAIKKALRIDKPVVLDVVTDTYAIAKNPQLPK